MGLGRGSEACCLQQLWAMQRVGLCSRGDAQHSSSPGPALCHPSASPGSTPAASLQGKLQALLGTGIPVHKPLLNRGTREGGCVPDVWGALWSLLGDTQHPECHLQGQSCRNCMHIKMQLVLPGRRGAASVPTDSFTCLEVESVQYLAGSAELINLFNNNS